jgi:hypothetical protein
MTDRTAQAPALRAGATVYVLDPASYGPSVKFPGAWTVDKVNQKTCKLSQRTGDGPARILNCDKTLISTTVPAAGAVTDYRAPWSQGQIVRWDAAPLLKTGGMTLFVVIADDGGPAVTRMVTLGNTTGRYWRRIPAAQLTPLTLADILAPGVQR